MMTIGKGVLRRSGDAARDDEESEESEEDERARDDARHEDDERRTSGAEEAAYSSAPGAFGRRDSGESRPGSDGMEEDEDDGGQADGDDEGRRSGRERGFAAKMIGDLARRALTTGIGSVFMSEDALRGSLSELKLPKEAMSYVMGQADRTKKEIVAVIARETREFLARLEVDKALARALVGTTIEINTRIRVIPKGEGMTASVESSDARLAKTEPLADDGAGKGEEPAPTEGSAGARRRRVRRRRSSDGGGSET